MIAVGLLVFTPAAQANWVPVAGRLKQVSVGSSSNIWGLDPNGGVYKWDGRQFQSKPGQLNHISAAADGSVWGTDPNGGVYQWQGNNWVPKAGKLGMISVGGRGKVWGTDGGGGVYKWNGQQFQAVGGSLQMISVGSDGTIWGTDRNGGIYARSGSNWVPKAGKLSAISVGSASAIWGVDGRGGVYKWDGRQFQSQAGSLTQISVGGDGTIWGTDRNGGIYKWSAPKAAKPRPRPRPAKPRVTRIDVNPKVKRLYPGQSFSVSASAYGRRNRQVAAVLTFSATGGAMNGSTYTAGQQCGTFRITVGAAGCNVTGTCTVKIVEPRTLTSIALSVNPNQLHPGQQAQVKVFGLDQNNKRMRQAISLSCEGGSFNGTTFIAGNQPGTFQIVARANGSNVHKAVSITIVEPVRLTLLSFTQPVLRCRVGGQVTLQLNGWDQYNRPCQVNLAELNWQCKGASINSQTLVFSAPRRPGHYYIRVRVPGGPKTAWAWADVYVHR